MTDPSDLELEAARHRQLASEMPHAWNAFFAGFGALRPIQLEAMPQILAGKNVLATAPTAGGKTEAVIAPLAERLVRHRWQGLSVLVTTPTRALVNDLFERLELPLRRMRLILGRKTADHSLSTKVNEQLLITTPESIESLLTFRRDTLQNVHAVVLDEIHLLDGTPRGDQLRMLLHRLAAFRHHNCGQGFAGLQLIALSATVSDPQRLAAAYLGNDATIVQVGGQRELESRVIFASGDDQARAEATIDSLDEFHNARKILVFVNSRKQVDSGAGYFRYGRFEKTPVFGHHGSLSKHERERTESRFKLEPTAICVATMTLEVGIDIGDVDLVVCMDPPFSLSSFLQRIGRGSRRRAGLTRVLCVARDRAGVLMFNALIYQARLSMPRVPLPPFRRSVLVQQILAYLKQVPRNARVLEQFLRVFASDAKPRIAAEDVESIVQDLVAENVLSKQRDVFLPASRGWDFIESNKIFSNIQPSPLEVALVDVDSGRVVARVKSVAPGAEGVRVAGTSYRLLKGGRGNVQPVRSDDGHDASPKYHARSLPYSAEVGASLAAYLEIRPEELVEVRVGQNAVLMTWLGKLNNALIAAELSRRSLKCSYGAFHVSLAVDSQRDLLQMLKESVVGILAHNPLPDLGIERMVDLGPHWQYLSPDMQRYGKADWLDRDYLHDWSSNLNHLREVSPSSDLGVNLLDLT